MQVAAGPGVGPGKHRNSQQANQTVHRPIERRGSRSGAYCPDRVPCLELGEIEPLQSLGENHCQSRKDMASKLFSERARDCGENFPKRQVSKLAEPAIPNTTPFKGKDESKGSYFTGPNLSLSYPPSLFRSEALSSLGTQVCDRLQPAEEYMGSGGNPRVNRAVRDLILAPSLELKTLKFFLVLAHHV